MWFTQAFVAVGEMWPALKNTIKLHSTRQGLNMFSLFIMTTYEITW